MQSARPCGYSCYRDADISFLRSFAKLWSQHNLFVRHLTVDFVLIRDDPVIVASANINSKYHRVASVAVYKSPSLTCTPTAYHLTEHKLHRVVTPSAQSFQIASIC